MKVWIKEYAELITIVTVVSAATWYISHEIHSSNKEISEKMHVWDNNLASQITSVERELSHKIYALDKDLAVIKTMLMMKENNSESMASINKLEK